MISDDLKKIQKVKPLIHSITNIVTINDLSQIIRNIGALPVMAVSPEESKEVTAQSDAFMINTGTLTKERVKAIKSSLRKANDNNIPAVIDIVGYGLSMFRKKTIDSLLKNNFIDIIKGNKSEIAKLCGYNARLKGIESMDFNDDIKSICKDLSLKYNCIVVATAKDDIVTDGNKIAVISNGTELMSRIVGTGCFTGGLLAVFASVNNDFFNSSINALAYFGVIGELSYKKNIGYVEFKNNLIDNIYKYRNIKELNNKIRIKII